MSLRRLALFHHGDYVSNNFIVISGRNPQGFKSQDFSKSLLQRSLLLNIRAKKKKKIIVRQDNIRISEANASKVVQ